MMPKRHGRGDTGFQPVLANHRHNAFYGKSWGHSNGASELSSAAAGDPPARRPEGGIIPECGDWAFPGSRHLLRQTPGALPLCRGRRQR